MNQHEHAAAPGIDRRAVLGALSAIAVGTVTFQRALAADVEAKQVVTPEMIEQAEWIAGLRLDDEKRSETAATVQDMLGKFASLRRVELAHDVSPALLFFPSPSVLGEPPQPRGTATFKESGSARRPESSDDLAFLPVTELAALLRSRQVSSVELTRLYLDRLHAANDRLQCVVSFTDELALRQAAQADRELAAARWRGPLHGIPWGAKDLISYPGYRTTWGALPFQDQLLQTKATVAQRLDDAGAVLVAKLSLGALAWGDQWFGGLTRNPWNTDQGSSGSSAGSAAATAAGLVGFAIGSETLGSIVSPCARCGVTGLRPTFGRVSRHGCMPLAWSMDKIGPIARSVEDCALVFDVIHGRDGLDATALERPFHWPSLRDPRTLKVGYFPGAPGSQGANGSAGVPGPDEARGQRPELAVLAELGVQLVPIQLPNSLPAGAISLILNTEAAAVFDELTRNNVTEGLNRWPPFLRQGEFVPAVEYLRANRVRSLLIREMENLMTQVDLYVGGDDLTIANLTGHPTVVVPNGFVERDGKRLPSSLTFTGRLFGESELLSIAHAYQRATGFHLERPKP